MSENSIPLLCGSLSLRTHTFGSLSHHVKVWLLKSPCWRDHVEIERFKEPQLFQALAVWVLAAHADLWVKRPLRCPHLWPPSGCNYMRHPEWETTKLNSVNPQSRRENNKWLLSLYATKFGVVCYPAVDNWNRRVYLDGDLGGGGRRRKMNGIVELWWAVVVGDIADGELWLASEISRICYSFICSSLLRPYFARHWV